MRERRREKIEDDDGPSESKAFSVFLWIHFIIWFLITSESDREIKLKKTQNKMKILLVFSISFLFWMMERGRDWSGRLCFIICPPSTVLITSFGFQFSRMRLFFHFIYLFIVSYNNGVAIWFFFYFYVFVNLFYDLCDGGKWKFMQYIWLE